MATGEWRSTDNDRAVRDLGQSSQPFWTRGGAPLGVQEWLGLWGASDNGSTTVRQTVGRGSTPRHSTLGMRPNGEATLSVKRREWQRLYAADRRNKRAALIEEAIGKCCFFCSSNRRGTGGLVAHRKNGEAHKAFSTMADAEFEEAMASGEYVRVCYKCHHGIHWAMEFLGLSWEEMAKRANRGL